MKKMWMVKTDCSFDGNEHWSDVYLYEKYENAKACFDKLVKEDKEENYKDQYEDESGEYPFEYEETDSYWCIWETGRYCENHSEAILDSIVCQDSEG